MRSLGAVLVFLLATLASPLSALAATTIRDSDRNFDHFSTGYPLLGAHATTACVSCHVKGAMRGTPRRCSACHDGTVAAGKNAGHVATTAECNTCHDPRSSLWAVTSFDHSGVTGACVTCHNGTQSIGKDGGHIASSNKCEACHNSVATFRSIRLPLDHREVVGVCSACHASDKPARHIPIPPGAECGACHRNDQQGWTPTLFDHSQIGTMNCATCHTGQFPPAEGPGLLPAAQTRA